jgi:hypothetical protein
MRILTNSLLSLVLISIFAVPVFAGTIAVSCDPSGQVFNLQGGAHSTSVQFFGYVTDDGAPVTGATVLFTMVYPDGTVSQKSSRTDSTGRAKATFNLNQAGDYSLTKSVTVDGQTASCTETFSVVLNG